MKLLIVEDHKETIQLYNDNIESFNKTSDEKIEPVIFETLSDAKASLESPDFDAAIVDLKLTSSGVELEGLEIVDRIEKNLRFPIFIVSGSIAQIERPETAFLKKRSRDGDFKEILKEIVTIYKTGITKILGRKGIIEKYLNTIFWDHLSSSMDLWIKDTTRDSDQKEKSLLRYTLLHMQEYIDLDIEEYHPSEFYITEPIKKEIFTGDIVTYDNNRYVILTPSCDIVLRKGGSRNADFILLCKIKKLEEIVKNFNSLNAATSSNNENRQRLIGFIENKNQRYHFIPKSENIEPGLIDFQDKLTLPKESIVELLKSKKINRISTISLPFLKDIISRYSNYYSRQGSPDFNLDEIYDSLFESKTT